VTPSANDQLANIPAGRKVLLCADDFAISNSVSTGIEELVAVGRLSATSAFSTFPEWPSQAKRLAALRGNIAIGLHLNFTVGAPLGAMPSLAPSGTLPDILPLVRRALARSIDPAEIEAETLRQLNRFAEHVGHVPDYLDGHQHAHALPGVGKAVLAALTRFENGRRPMMVRDPGDRPDRIVLRRRFVRKALKLGWLVMGFGAAARATGHAVNDGFSGHSEYSTSKPYVPEIEASFTHCGPRHLTMCHPGYADELLATRDWVTARREQEYTVLRHAVGLTERLWRPDRTRADLWADWRV
jgi:chitin disaccharide deacetylase